MKRGLLAHSTHFERNGSMRLSVIAVMVGFIVTAFSLHVSAESVVERFQKTAKAMACPGVPSVEQINLNGHKFNANKDMWISGSRVKGHFNHHLTWRPDDDIDFSFSSGPGGIIPEPLEDVRIEVNRGGFFGWVDDLIDGTIGSFFGLLDIQPDEVLVLQRGFTPVGEPVRCGACEVRDTRHDVSAGDRSACQAPTPCPTRVGARPSPTPSRPGALSRLGLFFHRKLMRTTKTCASMTHVI
jgi:hypothetical protein